MRVLSHFGNFVFGSFRGRSYQNITRYFVYFSFRLAHLDMQIELFLCLFDTARQLVGLRSTSHNLIKILAQLLVITLLSCHFLGKMYF